MVGVQNIKFLIKKGGKFDLKEVHFSCSSKQNVAKTLVAIDVIRSKNYEFQAFVVNQISVYS